MYCGLELYRPIYIASASTTNNHTFNNLPFTQRTRVQPMHVTFREDHAQSKVK